MKVFISWSGERSQALAQTLRDWLPLVLHYVEPWLSEADIAAGERWAEAVAKELEASNFGIICVTSENVGSQWVLFEAGALAKSMQGSRVIPLLLDLEFRDITGPLAQFQAKKVEKSGLSEVVHSINNAASQAVPEARAKQLFDALWPEFEKTITSIPKEASATKHTRPQHEVLEELVASVRSLDSRFRDISEESPRQMRSRRFKFHPFMLREFAEMVGEKPGDPILLLIAASMFREDAPWLYELGIEAYRAAKSGVPEESERTLRRFQRAAELMERGPFAEEMGLDLRGTHMIMRELRHFFPSESTADEESKAKSRRKKEEQEDEGS
ncbi:MAG: toll/interleukin-1 receptor domain-containing protein [Acidobacteriota bacterium]